MTTYAVSYNANALYEIAADINNTIGNEIGESGFVADSVIAISHAISRFDTQGVHMREYSAIVIYAVHTVTP